MDVDIDIYIYFFFSLNYSSSLSTSESRAALRLLRLFFDPLRSFGSPFRTFRQHLASPARKIDIFFCYGEIFLPNTQGLPGCLLGFWPSWQKACGGNNNCPRFFKNRARKGLPKSTQRIAKTSLWVE